ncbi:MAG: DUF4965 domain-containing protein [Bacteroidales bacterium]
MKIVFSLILTLCILFPVKSQSSDDQTLNFRPPSVPLVTHDPYFSIWSPADRLSDQETVHWTGTKNPLHCMIRIDGQAFRIMGANPTNIEPLKQTGLSVTPTRSLYEFGNSKIKLSLSFTSPLLTNDLDVLSRPVTYVSWNIYSDDGQIHDIQLYFDCGAEIAVNTPEQSVTWEEPAIQGLKTAKIGCLDQKYLNKPGDNIRIDWGYVYLSVPQEQNAIISINSRASLFNSFIKLGKLPESEAFVTPRNVKDGFISMAAVWTPGKVGSSGIVQWAMLAYDDIYSIRYFEDDLQAWWRRNGLTFDRLLQTASKDYNKLINNCISFDKELMADLEKSGGKNYAQMCALVYRQCLAAQKLVADKKGLPLLFPKENFSNGCISTVDVIYPFSPFVLLFSPALTKAMLQPVLDYSVSQRWKFPFAPHDLGKYPYATGQVYGGGEKDERDQMPVEETGNMIIMLTALAKAEGNANYSKKYWPLIEKWADYLLSKGFDPENQLCTDDFAGHLAHNVNLSAKAIVAIASISVLCEMTGDKEKANDYRKKAESMAKDWIRLATEGNHTLLAYDQPSTWSQKYNLVWDKLLDLNLFPKEVFQKEINFYKTVQAQYGLPLDNRERYTKNDWITWTATLADNKNDFKTIFDPVYYFADNTPNRVPVSDWYIVDNAQQRGFQARSVVGGFFIRMLSDKTIWNKWASK